MLWALWQVARHCAALPAGEVTRGERRTPPPHTAGAAGEESRGGGGVQESATEKAKAPLAKAPLDHYQDAAALCRAAASVLGRREAQANQWVWNVVQVRDTAETVIGRWSRYIPIEGLRGAIGVSHSERPEKETPAGVVNMARGLSYWAAGRTGLPRPGRGHRRFSDDYHVSFRRCARAVERVLLQMELAACQSTETLKH
eukprot:489892-Prorocentrum_minimum.AAC.1